MTAEHERLREAREHGIPWREWGPYLRERQWGIARENQAPVHRALRDLTYERASAWAYEWGEDGLAGICDEQMRLCFAVALWNGRDRVLKERLGGAPSDACIYLDNVPTHSYMRVLYRYSGCFDIFVEYAKAFAQEILIRITIDNRGPERACVHVLPHLWFRNSWQGDSRAAQPLIERCVARANYPFLVARHANAGVHYLQYEAAAEVLFTNNETHSSGVHVLPNATRCAKAGICAYIVDGRKTAVHAGDCGTKAAVHYDLTLAPGGSRFIRLKLGTALPGPSPFLSAKFDGTILQRRREAAQFYASFARERMDGRVCRTVRRAFATAFWSKQTHLYEISGWVYDRRTEALSGADNRTRFQMASSIVLALPDKWERPRLGASSAVLHALALARVDPDLARGQLESLLNADRVKDAVHASVMDDRQDTSLHAWAALLMYRLQRIHHSQHAFLFLRYAFNLLRAREVQGAWAGLHAQSMFEIAVELASIDSRYEQAAIVLYPRFVSVISENGMSNPKEIPVDLASPVGLISTAAAAVLPDSIYKRLPGLVEHIHALSARWQAFGELRALKAVSINGRRVLSIVDECTLRGLLARLVNAQGAAAASDDPSYSLPCAVVLLRALVSLHDAYGDALRVPVAPGSPQTRTLFELSCEIAHRIRGSMLGRSHGRLEPDRVGGQAAHAHWRDLISLYELVYSEDSQGAERTGWACLIAPLLCLAFEYQIFQRDASQPDPRLRVIYQRGGAQASEDTGSVASRIGQCGSPDGPAEISRELS